MTKQPMKVKVKICGIRHRESAEAAIEAGADFLGFNFVLSSQRYINPLKAKAIIDKVRKKTEIVGIFQNTSVNEINELVTYLKLPIIQLYGNEDIQFIKKIKAEVIKVFHIPSNGEIQKGFHVSDENILGFLQHDNGNYILLDRALQGQGSMIDMERAKIIAEKYPTFIAGGLHPENVASVISQTQPYAVDVAEGIETNGVEDIRKIQEFIKKSKGAR